MESRLWQAIEELDVDALTAAMELGDGEAAARDLRPALPVLSAWRRRHRERSTLDSWRYRMAWTHLPEPPAPTLTGAWLVLVPAGHVTHPAAVLAVRALEEHGADAVRHVVEPQAGREDLAGLLSGAPSGVVSLLALDETAHPGHPAVPAGLAATAALVQAADDVALTAPLWCLTQGAGSPGRAGAGRIRRARVAVPRMATWSSGWPGASSPASRRAVRSSMTSGRSTRPPQRPGYSSAATRPRPHTCACTGLGRASPGAAATAPRGGHHRGAGGAAE